MQLKQIYCYPLKSGKAIGLSHTTLSSLGVEGDRRLMVIDSHNQFVSARSAPQLCLVECHLEGDRVTLVGPRMPSVSLSLTKVAQRAQVQIWRSDVNVSLLDESAHHWISEYLQGDYRLCFFDEQSERAVNKAPEYQVSFADICPVLLIGQASLDALNEYTGRSDQMLQFRPNLVVDSGTPYAEESWQIIRIGDVELMAVKPCGRCQVTTLDPHTAIFDPADEPLKSLEKFHSMENGKIVFGQYFVVTKAGGARLGDKVTVVSECQPPQYRCHTDSSLQEAKSSYQVFFDQAGVMAKGDTDQTLLEIAEEHDVDLPSSCRSGSCGTCRVKLIDGQVEVGADYALSDQEIEEGYILACSCFPRSDLVISQED
ncbi:MAG: putative protein YcbX [Candidatus Celerinatantimonas neptuna]|nr:MAG: putative protein YcbX [Candidatus Celerinatantimonas neptuna]